MNLSRNEQTNQQFFFDNLLSFWLISMTSINTDSAPWHTEDKKDFDAE